MKWDKLTAQKAKLDTFRPLSPALVANLEKWFVVELTYTSNAIEGNTLTRQETAVVVEKGLTVSGKTLVEHLEATNHAKALEMVMGLVQMKTSEISERTILNIHETILKGIDDDCAGRYRMIPVRISGSAVMLPNHLKVPDKMTQFVSELTSDSQMHPVELAAMAHYELVTIHPFVDGNGRTARLLLNLILLQNGYPPALIRKRDRLKYLKALEQAQLGESKKDYLKIIFDAVNRSFDVYLKAVTNTDDEPEKAPQLLKIGQLGKETGETVATLRFWTKEGLLEIAEVLESGYQLYDLSMVARAKKIRDLQAERFTLREIKEKLS